MNLKCYGIRFSETITQIKSYVFCTRFTPNHASVPKITNYEYYLPRERQALFSWGMEREHESLKKIQGFVLSLPPQCMLQAKV